MERRTSRLNNYNHKRSRSRLIPPEFVKLTATTPTNHDYPNGIFDHNANQEALEILSSCRSRDYFNLLEEGNCTNDVSTAIAIDREILSISDITEKKTNINTIRVNEVKHILKVSPQCLRTNYNNTKNIFTYETDTKYSSKADRHKTDQNKRQDKAKYYLPEFWRENEKHITQDRSNILNSVASSSEDVDLPHKRYCSIYIYCIIINYA